MTNNMGNESIQNVRTVNFKASADEVYVNK